MTQQNDLPRQQILLTLFPSQQSGENDQPTDSVHSLQYDTESLCYCAFFAPTPLQEDSAPHCAICLEAVLDESITGAKCQHVYHYQCLMEWMMQDHNDCPTCRAALWDTAAYDMIANNLFPPTNQVQNVSSQDRVHRQSPPTAAQQRQSQQSQTTARRRTPTRAPTDVINDELLYLAAKILVSALSIVIFLSLAATMHRNYQRHS